MNTTEMKMLRWIQGKTRKYHIRNVVIWEKAHTKLIQSFLMKNTLQLFGQVHRIQRSKVGDNYQPQRKMSTQVYTVARERFFNRVVNINLFQLGVWGAL